MLGIKVRLFSTVIYNETKHYYARKTTREAAVKTVAHYSMHQPSNYHIIVSECITGHEGGLDDIRSSQINQLACCMAPRGLVHCQQQWSRCMANKLALAFNQYKMTNAYIHPHPGR